MTILGKKQMSEEDIKLNFITPAIQRGWKGHITMETRITDGRINIRGNIVVRSKPKFADYLLYLNDGKPIAVVEAKDNNHSVSHGLQQAMTYAQMMDLPFAYSSNGDAFYEHDLMIKPQLGEKMADFACGTGGFITSWLGQLSGQVTDTTAQKQLDDSIYGVEKKPFPYLLCVTNMLLHDIEVPNIYHMNSLKHNLLDYTDEDKFDVILMNPPYGGHEDKSIQGFFPDDLASAETADLFMSVIMYRLKKKGRAAVVVPDGFLFGLDNAKVNIKKKLISQFNLHTVVRLPGSVFSPYTSITTNLLFFDNTKPTTETWFYRVDIPSDRKHFSKTKPMELKHFDDCIAWWNDRKEIPDGENFKAQKFTAEYLLNEQGCNIDLCGYPHEEEEILDPLDTIREYQERRTTLNAEIDKVLAELEALLPGGVIE